jgi:predicted flap endonuclease-1-like 5' DNA nuclease
MLLFSFCDCHWLLPWLLPFLLGALLGWLLGRGRKETVVEEKIVYKDKIVYQDKIVYKDAPSTGVATKVAAAGAAVAAAKVEEKDKEDDYLACKEYEGREVNDKKNNVALFKHTDGQFYFALYNADKSVKLRSEGFKTSQERDQELSGVLRFHDKPSMYKTLTRGKYSMDVLYDDTGREVGRSCLKKQEDAKPAAPKAAAPIKAAAAATGAAGKVSIYSHLKSDNLQVVEGIGPKMDEVMKKHGIKTWAELASKSPEQLRGILDKENPTRYRIIDPTTWPEQARLANAGKWADLIDYQKRLDTGRIDVGDGATDAKVEKLLIKMGILKKWSKDDLKAVEGIGPKIEKLLHNAGIKTWKALSETSVATIQGILDKAGSRYQLADPGTWPKQAEMAAKGDWDALKEYQDFLQGGK